MLTDLGDWKQRQLSKTWVLLSQSQHWSAESTLAWTERHWRHEETSLTVDKPRKHTTHLTVPELYLQRLQVIKKHIWTVSLVVWGFLGGWLFIWVFCGGDGGGFFSCLADGRKIIATVIRWICNKKTTTPFFSPLDSKDNVAKEDRFGEQQLNSACGIPGM